MHPNYFFFFYVDCLFLIYKKNVSQLKAKEQLLVAYFKVWFHTSQPICDPADGPRGSAGTADRHAEKSRVFSACTPPPQERQTNVGGADVCHIFL